MVRISTVEDSIMEIRLRMERELITTICHSTFVFAQGLLRIYSPSSEPQHAGLPLPGYNQLRWEWTSHTAECIHNLQFAECFRTSDKSKKMSDVDAHFEIKSTSKAKCEPRDVKSSRKNFSNGYRRFTELNSWVEINSTEQTTFILYRCSWL